MAIRLKPLLSKLFHIA